MSIARTIKNRKLDAYLYTNLAHLYIFYGEPKKAETYLRNALSITKKDVDRDSKILVYQFATDYFYGAGKYDTAIYYAYKTLDLLKNDKFGFGNLQLMKTLYKSFLAKNDYENAVKYFEIYDKIRDSINIEEKAVNIERLKLESEYEKRDQIRILEEKKKKFVYIIVGLVLITILLILLVILEKYKRRLSNEKMEKKLVEAKKKELKTTLELKDNILTAKAMAEIHRTEIIQGILEDLKAIKRKAVKKETQNAIEYIAQRLGKEINTDIWKEFEVSFEQVHESFYKNLNKKHPDLSSGERRLCALLKLNLTSKEIAQITGQSYKSVENARTRLRKKLGLTNKKIDLTVYLNSFS